MDKVRFRERERERERENKKGDGITLLLEKKKVIVMEGVHLYVRVFDGYWREKW